MTHCKACGAMYLKTPAFPVCPICQGKGLSSKGERFELATDKLDVNAKPLPHVTQITLTDTLLALALNAIQFAIISVDKHPLTRGDKAAKVRAMMEGLEALDTFTPTQFGELIIMLQNAAKDISDSNLEQRGSEF